MLYRSLIIAAAPLLTAAVESTSTRALDLESATTTTATTTATVATNTSGFDTSEMTGSGQVGQCDAQSMTTAAKGTADSVYLLGNQVATNCGTAASLTANKNQQAMEAFKAGLDAARTNSLTRTTLSNALTNTHMSTSEIQQMFLWVGANVDAHTQMAKMFAYRLQGTNAVIGQFKTLYDQVQDIRDALSTIEGLINESKAQMAANLQAVNSAINSNQAGADKQNGVTK